MTNRDLEKRREYGRRRIAKLYATRRTIGLCIKCGAAALIDKKMCSDCLVRNVEYQRMSRKRRMARGLCIHCAKRSRTGRQSCLDCAMRFKANYYRKRHAFNELAKEQV